MAKKLKIQNGCGPDREWSPVEFHRVHPSLVGEKKHWWKVDSIEFEGIYVLGEDKPRRTRGKPKTAERVLANFGEAIREAATLYGDNVDWWDLATLMVATFATENSGKLVGDRYEKHIDDWSFGGAQFLTATARAVAVKLSDAGYGPRVGLPLPPGQSMRQDGSDANKAAWKAYLEEPRVAAHLMARFHYDNHLRFDARMDPVLLYAAYNAGSPRPSKQTKFGLVYYDPDKLGPRPGAVDHFTRWYGDAAAVIGDIDRFR